MAPYRTLSSFTTVPPVPGAVMTRRMAIARKRRRVSRGWWRGAFAPHPYRLSRGPGPECAVAAGGRGARRGCGADAERCRDVRIGRSGRPGSWSAGATAVSVLGRANAPRVRIRRPGLPKVRWPDGRAGDDRPPPIHPPDRRACLSRGVAAPVRALPPALHQTRGWAGADQALYAPRKPGAQGQARG